MPPVASPTNTPESQRTGSSRDPALVQQALEEIVRSTPFRTTRQCQDLLRYVVDHTLSGQEQSLRERVIGAEVFGRKPDYDTSEDPVVRIRAADVRRRLAQYYQGFHGSTPLVRIDVPSGSYRATFEWNPEPLRQQIAPPEQPATELRPASPSAPDAELLPTETMAYLDGPEDRGASTRKRSSPHRWALIAACLVLLLLCGGALVRLWRPSAQTEFDEFWAPMAIGSKPVLICMGTNVVYRLSSEFLGRYMKERGIPNQGVEFYVHLPDGSQVDARDIQPAWNSFVALGDVAAVSDLVAALTRQGRTYQQRFPPDISFAELRNTPTILVGGFNNALTLALTKDLRFVLKQSNRVEDNQDPSKRWVVQFHGDSHDTEDYAVISRLLDSKSGGPVISVAGIGQYGTQAAAEFVSNSQMIGNLVRSAPAGWSKKSMQVVLHIKVIDYRPVSTEVVATHYW